ncbi:MAG TPA: 2-oxoglutarate dehydrogenase E1 component [Verrucomicrobiae bacterium]|nr:2-oxoglutarate dehydrogenase E1 component [Verrucomicrobiae bacterium]
MREEESPPGTMNLAFLEGLYADYLRNPSSVSSDWQEYFSQIRNGDHASEHGFAPDFPRTSVFNPPIALPASERVSRAAVEEESTNLQDRVDQLIRAYRICGHLIAQIDPLSLPRPVPTELDPAYYGFTEADMDRRFSCETMHCRGFLTLRQIIERLRNTYCRTIGVEYMHIDDLSIRSWLQERMEPTENRVEITRKEQLRILTRLTDAVTFEEFIRKKFIGAKSFSLEGSESLVPLLDLAIEKAGDQGVQEVVLGMAHRGRLNVLCNIMGKSPGEIFREFGELDAQAYSGSGDVKYHKGYSNDWRTLSKKTVHISLCFNPSHLEFVNPVALGRMRAKQDRVGDTERSKGLTILIHGDAAFAGQGVVQESLNLSQLKGYTVGGTLHIVVNNQIGFTTSPSEGRSTTYATDVAKMLPIPIFHVNGEDPEAVAQCVRLALDYRATFKRDVVIDMYGYRRLGHNEADEPSFTQPLLYKAIEKRKPVREGYLEHLLKLGELSQKDANRIWQSRQDHFEKEFAESKAADYIPPTPIPRSTWKGYYGGSESSAKEINTGYPKDRLIQLLRAQTELPPDFHPHPKIEKFLANRKKMADGEAALDWSAAEALAFGSLSVDGARIRLSGQDVGRGTFSHRHSVLHDYEDGQTYVPLQHLSPDQAPVEIFNSPLSEVGVLGFEYGYSLDRPRALVVWEAQFGDFCNVAQVIVDQFIASAEDKWRRLSALVLLLPHGYEGQGPEHSSARLERFLALAAEDNMQVVYPSTPAQYFHLMRRQFLRQWRKPLIVMSPKSLLRQPDVHSSLDDCAKGQFQRVIPDDLKRPGDQVKRILLCTGKIYYELRKRRADLKRDDVAIVRIEQLYPLRREVLESDLASYPAGIPAFWVQEEPENMGPWRYMRVNFGQKLFERFPFSGIYREASASPATGSAIYHKKEQERILADAFEQGSATPATIPGEK